MAILPDPPPAYDESLSRPRSRSSPSRFAPALGALPEHLIIQILSHLSLSDLHANARLANRRLFLCSTHLLRRWLQPAWRENLADCSSTDPLGLAAPSAHSSHPRATSTANYAGRARSGSAVSVSARNGLNVFRFRTNETVVFDLFIAACAREYWNATASTLLLRPSCTPSTTHDLFSFLQPRARLTDLIVQEGALLALVAPIDRVRPPPAAGEVSCEPEAEVLGEDLEIKLAPRRVELMLPRQSPNTKSARVMRTVVDVPRKLEGEESWESLAARCASALVGAGLARVEGQRGRGACYVTANGR